MKSVNYRFVLIAAVVLVLLGGIVHIVHGIQVGRHAEFFLARAEKAEEESRPEDAIASLNRYLRLVPEDSEALARLGLLQADSGRRREAYVTLEKTLRQDPSRQDVRRRLTEVAVEIGRYENAREHLERYLLPAAPNDAELLERLARCQLAAGDLAASAKSLEAAIQSDPQRIDAYLLLAVVTRRQPPSADGPATQSPGEAVARLLDKMVENNPDAARAYLGRATLRWQRAQFAQALDDAQAALKLEPRNLDALNLAARSALGLKQLDNARKYAESAMNMDPKRAAAYTTLAEVELAAGDRRKAVEWLRRGLSEVAGQTTIPVILARLLLEDGNLDEAQQTVRAMRERRYPPATVDYFQALIQYRHGRWLEAERLLSDIVPQVAGAPDTAKQVHYWIGQCHQRLGNIDRELDAYRRALVVDRLYWPAHLATVNALARAGRYDEAIEQLRGVQRLGGPTAAVAPQLVHLLVLKNMRLAPDRRDWAEVAAVMGQVPAGPSQSAIAPLLQAQVLIAQGRLPEAERSLQDARAKHPNEPAIWIGLIDVLQAQQRGDDAARLLDEAEAQLGDIVGLRLARAGLVVRAGETTASEQLLKLAGNAERFTEAERLALWRGLLGLAGALDDDRIAPLCRAIAKEDPQDLGIWSDLFRLAARARDNARMDQALDRIRGMEGEGPMWHYCQAARLAASAEPPSAASLRSALAHLAEVRRSRPTWAAAPLLSARIEEQLGNSQQALQDYLRAVELRADSPEAVRRAVALLYERQDYARAGELLSQLAELNVEFSGDLERLTSRVWERLDRLHEALALARRAAEGSDDYRDHVWLGQLLAIYAERARSAGRQDEADKTFAEAEQALLRARSLADDAPATWFSLVQFLVAAGRRQEAEAMLSEMARKTPPEKLPRAMAVCSALLGNLDDAAGHWQKALAAAPGDALVVRQAAEFCIRADRPQIAESQLRQIATGKVKAGDDDVAWCRRALALALRDRGGYDNLNEALALVEKNLALDPDSILDRRTKAVLLSGHPARARRQEAARILEDLLASGEPGGGRTRGILARLYLADGDWNRAARHLRLAGDADSLLALVQGLIERDELAEAEQRLKQLAAAAPGQFAVEALRARLLFARGEFDGALGILTEAGRQGNEPSGDPQATVGAALTIEQLAASLKQQGSDALALRFIAEAEALLRKYASRQPDEVLVLAAFLARQGRLDEALKLADQAPPGAPPEAAAGLIQSCLAGAGGRPADLARLEPFVETALSRYDRPLGLLLAAVGLREAQQRYDDVVALYREMLTKEPDNAAVKNNLAFLLALRHRGSPAAPQLAEALTLVESAVRSAGPVAAFLDTRGVVLLTQGQQQAALADLRSAVAEGPEAGRYFHLAEACAAAGRQRDAVEALREAEQSGLDPLSLHPLERPALEALSQKLR